MIGKQKTISLPDWGLIMVFLVISLIYFSGITLVPFHPDESSQIYMSSDVELLFSSPAKILWSPEKENDTRQKYRELDSPITRDLIGIGRLISGQRELKTDWDWSRNWQENQQTGALPDASILLISRFSVAFLFPFTMVLIYKSGKIMGGKVTAWLSLLLLASNGLILVHTRRAMAESGLIFTTSLMIYSFLKLKNKNWLVAVPAALAFNAKQSVAALVILGMISILWAPSTNNTTWYIRIRNLGGFLLIFVFITLVLNPFLWSNPIRATQSAMQSRQNLLERQVETFQSAMPERILFTPMDRIIGLIGNLFIIPPQVEEVGNYLSNTQNDTLNYFINPLNNLYQNFPLGSLMLLFTIGGLIVLVLKIINSPGEPGNREKGLICIGGILEAASLLVFIPLPFQRYVLPLVPFTCLWIASGFSWVINKIINKKIPESPETLA